MIAHFLISRSWVRFFFTVIITIYSGGCNSIKKDDKSESQEVLKDTRAKTVSDSEKEIDLPIYMVQGEKLYTQHCLTCHQSNGKGVSGLNPPINNTEYVTGEKDRLLKIIIYGSNVGLVVKGSTYSNAMPAFGALSDLQIANITSYIRSSFGNNAEAITEEEVSAYRANKNN